MIGFGWFRQRRQKAQSVRRLIETTGDRLAMAREETRAASQQAQAAAGNRLTAAEELRDTIKQTLDRVLPDRSPTHARR